MSLIHFGVYAWPDLAYTASMAGVYSLSDLSIRIVIDRSYRFLPFPALSAILFHEILHTGFDDDVAGLPEESIASALEAIVYMQLLLAEPALAELPDELTRFNNNYLALLRLNSGPSGSDRLTLFVPDSDINIDPTATDPLTEFYEYYARHGSNIDPDSRDRETTGHWLLREVLKHLAESGATPPANADFDRATLEFIDQNLAALTPAELIAVACILKLDVPCQ